jgi:hypothetical protein
MSACNALVPQLMTCDFGYPDATIESPWNPPRLKRTGTAPPAFITLKVG